MKIAMGIAAALVLSACAKVPLSHLAPETQAMYAAVEDGEILVPAIPEKYLTEDRKRQEVDYYAPHEPGTIIVDPAAKRLYHILGENRAMRYTVGVGKQGRGFYGEARVSFQRDWPYWTPTANMLRREPELYEQYRGGIEGGLENPLGARAMYLYRGGKDTLYRIHGTPYPHTVGEEASGGCIRLFNQDAIFLASQVDNGTRVIVLGNDDVGKWTGPDGMIAEDAIAESVIVEEEEVAEAASEDEEQDEDA